MEKFSATSVELNDLYEAMTGVVMVECETTTAMVGGQPAKKEAVEAFVEHHLGLTGIEAEDAVSRILKEEVGERALPGLDSRGEDTGELKDKEVYGVNVVRRDSIGPWIGTHMVKAALKGAASRIGLFTEKKGAKGDMSEAGRILSHGLSKQSDNREKIHLYTPSGNGFKSPVTTFEEFMGSVSNAKGRTSIKHHSEVVPVGTRFAFEFRFMPTKINRKDVMGLFALLGEIGIGSVRSQDRGKFKVLSINGEIPDKKKDKENA